MTVSTSEDGPQATRRLDDAGVGGSGEPTRPAADPAGWRAAARAYPGLCVALACGVSATWLAQQLKAPVMLLALLIGMAFHFLRDDARCAPGIALASRGVLRVGVALLGARITLAEIASLGGAPIATMVVGVTASLLLGVWLAPAFGLRRSFGLLSGGAVGICGVSAALAIASALPPDKDRERDTLLVVVVVTGLSTIAMITYPLLVVALRLDHTEAGLFLGGTIHDVAQVVAAGYAVSEHTGDVATYVKLLRVALLAPVVLTVALVSRGQAASGAGRPGAPPLPYFLLGFAALVVINSFGWAPRALASLASQASSWCLVTAIGALGVKTSLRELTVVGWRPITLIAVETVALAALVLGAVTLMR